MRKMTVMKMILVALPGMVVAVRLRHPDLVPGLADASIGAEEGIEVAAIKDVITPAPPPLPLANPRRPSLPRRWRI